MGERVGGLVVKKLYQDKPQISEYDKLSGAFEFILRSLGVKFQVEQTANAIRYTLADDPLQATANRTGILRSIVPARHDLIALFTSLLATITDEWTISQPSANNLNEPLREIALKT